MGTRKKILIFDKVEIFLLLLFIIVLTTVSFTLGLRVGKKITYQKDGFMEEDREKVVLKSVEEESVEKMVNERTISKEKSEDQFYYHELKRELDKLDKKESERKKADRMPQSLNMKMGTHGVAKSALTRESSKKIKIKKETKYTVQLGVFSNREDAQKFSNGFSVRGHDPIIKVLNSRNRMTYRVSLGEFTTDDQALRYTQEEQALFSGLHPQVVKL